MARWLVILVLISAPWARPPARAEAPLKVGVFDVDASPPIGSPLAYDPTKEIVLPLSCRGVVLVGEGKPVVLCAVDWIGIANDGNKEFRRALADAAGTTPDRVEVHTLHQHDAPRCDFSAANLLAPHGIDGEVLDSDFARDVIARAVEAVRRATADARRVTHLGLGEAEVDRVASNRRILGPDGKVQFVRYTACEDPKIRAKPVGVIDPMLKLVGFWDGDEPVAALTFYATHPQSYYRTGGANPDFPGMARDARQAATGVPHIHFDGAGGNIGAGKWNDGSPENRQILADRVADGMARAWDAAAETRVAIAASDLRWETVPVLLPPDPDLDGAKLRDTLNDARATVAARSSAASDLAWLLRCKAGDPMLVSCLSLGPARVVNLPGELFVEYQLAAQKMRPDLFVAVAAYGDYAPGYIGTRVAYPQGGYEVGASRTAPEAEAVLTAALRTLLHPPADRSKVEPSEFTETVPPRTDAGSR